MAANKPSRRLSELSSAIFTEMARRKREVARKREVIDLGIGSPDQPPAVFPLSKKRISILPLTRWCRLNPV